MYFLLQNTGVLLRLKNRSKILFKHFSEGETQLLYLIQPINAWHLLRQLYELNLNCSC